MKIKPQCTLIALLLLAFAGQMARADLGFWSARLVGTWQHPTSGDIYQFKPNATYIFRVGAAKRRAGNISHSGFWKIVQPTQKESRGSLEGPVALSLKSATRTVLEGQTPRVLGSNRAFRLVVDVAHFAKTDEPSLDPNRYWIGGVRWRRVNPMSLGSNPSHKK